MLHVDQPRPRVPADPVEVSGAAPAWASIGLRGPFCFLVDLVLPCSFAVFLFIQLQGLPNLSITALCAQDNKLDRSTYLNLDESAFSHGEIARIFR